MLYHRSVKQQLHRSRAENDFWLGESDLIRVPLINGQRRRKLTSTDRKVLHLQYDRILTARNREKNMKQAAAISDNRLNLCITVVYYLLLTCVLQTDFNSFSSDYTTSKAVLLRYMLTSTLPQPQQRKQR